VGDDAEQHGQGHHGQHPNALGGLERVVGDEHEHHAGEPSWPEPSDQGDGGAVEARADQRQRHRHHAHDGEGGDGEGDVGPLGALERGHDHGGAEQEPHDQRQHLADVLGEGEALFVGVVGHRAEGQAGDEGGHEAVGVHRQRTRVDEHDHGQRRGRLEPGVGGTVAAGRADQPRAGRAGGDAPRHPAEDLPCDRPCPLAEAQLAAEATGDGRGQEHVDERGGDAVVEPALDVEHAADAQGDALVGEDRRAEGGVGGSHDGPDRAGHPHAQAADEQRRRTRSRQDREGQADGEQADRQAHVGPEAGDAHPRRVGEEQQGQGGFGDVAQVGRADVHLDDGERTVGDHEADDDHRHGGADVGLLGPRRHQVPGQHGRGHDGEEAGGHPVDLAVAVGAAWDLRPSTRPHPPARSWFQCAAQRPEMGSPP
jgi:hypothetical protein